MFAKTAFHTLLSGLALSAALSLPTQAATVHYQESVSGDLPDGAAAQQFVLDAGVNTVSRTRGVVNWSRFTGRQTVSTPRRKARAASLRGVERVVSDMAPSLACP